MKTSGKVVLVIYNRKTEFIIVGWKNMNICYRNNWKGKMAYFKNSVIIEIPKRVL